MRRRTACSLLLSGASASVLAACGAGLTATEEQESASTAQETEAATKAEPTAAPAEAQPTAAPAKEAEVAPTAAPALDMPNLGKAPEITLTGWFNSEPITMASLEGKASALIVFWTYT